MALSEINRGRIIGMWEAGLSSEDIAQRIPCTPQSVRKWISRYRIEGEAGLIDKRKNSRRSRSTIAEENMVLVLMACGFLTNKIGHCTTLYRTLRIGLILWPLVRTYSNMNKHFKT